MNVPVVATVHGGMLDIVKLGLTGVLFQPGDHAGLLSCISQLKTETLTDLREFVVVNFTLESVVEKTVRIYESLMID